MWRVRVGSFAIGAVIASVVACGGRTRIDGLGDTPSVSAGTSGADGISVAGSRPDTSTGGSMPAIGGAAAVAGSGAGAAVAGSGAGAAVAGSGAGAVTDSNLSNSCPQALGNRSCSAIELDISFSGAAEDPRTKFWIEPLQIPDYSQGVSVNQPKLDPSKWDRSPLPAGACVLRIHGLSGACLQPGALFVGTCAAHADPNASHVLPFSYYEADSCREGIAPGCPSASATDWDNGNWWYFVARGEDTDLVVCAPECGGPFSGEKRACLRTAGSG